MVAEGFVQVSFFYCTATPLSALYIPAGWLVVENCTAGQKVINVRGSVFFSSDEACKNMEAGAAFFDAAFRFKAESIAKLLKSSA